MIVAGKAHLPGETPILCLLAKILPLVAFDGSRQGDGLGTEILCLRDNQQPFVAVEGRSEARVVFLTLVGWSFLCVDLLAISLEHFPSDLLSTLLPDFTFSLHNFLEGILGM